MKRSNEQALQRFATANAATRRSTLTLPFMLFLDILVLAGCSFVLVRSRVLDSSLHPALTYLGYHFYTVTLRLVSLSAGAPSTAVYRWPIQPGEFVRAAVAFDLLLIASTAAWVVVAHRARHTRKLFQNQPAWPLLKGRTTLIAVPVFAIGLFSLIHFGAATQSRLDLGAWGSSSYVFVTVTWPIYALLLLHYFYGFRWYLTVTTAIVLFLMMLNTDRFAVVIPVLFLFYTYISRLNRRWFPKWVLVSIGILFVMWFPMKVIRAGITRHESPSDILEQTIRYDAAAVSVNQRSGNDSQFFDMAAVWMTLVRASGHFSYGRQYLPLLTVPIPRQIWPDKPKLSDYEIEMSTPEFPVSTVGAVPSLAGDTYTSFGYPGVIVCGFLIAYFYGWLWQRAAMVPHSTVRRFVYLVLLANLVQALRDGAGSILVFGLINSMPMAIAAAASCLHGILHPQKRGRGNLRPVEALLYPASYVETR